MKYKTKLAIKKTDKKPIKKKGMITGRYRTGNKGCIKGTAIKQLQPMVTKG